MKIGTVADRADVSVQTIRFYERRGLLPEPPRTDGGFRKYPSRTITRIRFIRRAKELGFTLDEIQDLLELRSGGGRSSEEVRERAADKLAEVEEKIRSLQEIRTALQGLIRRCDEVGATGPCPILDEFESEASTGYD